MLHTRCFSNDRRDDQVQISKKKNLSNSPMTVLGICNDVIIV